MKNSCWSFCLLVMLTAAVFLLSLHPKYALPVLASLGNPSHILVIDPGHGGEDGGAISLTGVPESQINLSIAKRLEDLLALCGTIPEMLRTEDVSLHSNSARTLRQKKTSDLQNRATAVEQIQNPILLSIHQNSYPQQKYHGAQIFYAPTPGSKPLAIHIQESLRKGLDPNNQRSAKPISKEIYLLNHISCPAVLVECGFLTNPAEEVLLRSVQYQRKLALSLGCAVLTYENETLNNQENDP